MRRKLKNDPSVWKVMLNFRGWSEGNPQVAASQPKGFKGTRSDPKDSHTEPGRRRVWKWGLVVQLLTTFLVAYWVGWRSGVPGGQILFVGVLQTRHLLRSDAQL